MQRDSRRRQQNRPLVPRVIAVAGDVSRRILGGKEPVIVFGIGAAGDYRHRAVPGL